MNSSNDKQGNKNRTVTNLILIVIVILLAVIPLVVAKNAEFGGADGQAEAAITEINPNYNPWFSSIFEPPSGEIESLLFALQAAFGSGILFYGLGYLRGRSKKEEKTKP
ncbi:MAG: energy-coupling factor ABC transporter substrate-binding protein [Candidatus Dehalobacter alkaniphilus]